MKIRWPNIKLDDDGKKKLFSVSAYPEKLHMDLDPCGYGATEVEALAELIDKIDQDISVLREAKAEAIAMLNQRRAS
jgi:hypothetical protein